MRCREKLKKMGVQIGFKLRKYLGVSLNNDMEYQL
jgi:hypothetical protein